MDASTVITGASRRSVGNSLATARVLAPGTPSFDQITQTLVDEVSKMVRAETERKRNAITILFPHALETSVLGKFIEDYPEYRLIPLNSMTFVQLEWVAHRYMALSLCMDAALNYSERLIVVGDALYQCATRDLRGVHLETDSADACGVHSRHSSAQEFLRACRSKVEIDKNHGYRISVSSHLDFFAGQAFQVCDTSHKCSQQADGLVLDLSMHPMTVTQACTAMATAGAEFTEAFMPYTSDIYRVDEGEFPDSGGVRFKKCGTNLDIVYPEGVAGVTRYPLSLWSEWLSSTNTTIYYNGEYMDFRLELRQHRGPFMYCQLVRVKGRQQSGVTLHALDMPWATGMYLFSYSRLKSASANPKHVDSWVRETNQLVPCSVVDKLYLHAMSLKAAEFTPENILRRVSKIDSRVIVTGMNVRVREPLSPDVAMQVACSVYTKAFISRYETSKLGTDLIRELQNATEFSKMGKARQLLTVFSAALRSVTVNPVTSLLDSWKSYLTAVIMERDGPLLPEFVAAPSFIILTEYNSWFSRLKRDVFARAYGGHASVPDLRGSTAAVLSAKHMKRFKRTDLVINPEQPLTQPTGHVFDEIVDTSEPGDISPEVQAMMAKASAENDVSRNSTNRMELHMQGRTPEVPQGHEGPEKYDRVPDPADTMNSVANRIFPGLEEQDFELDAPSMRFDPQHREYQAEYLVHPLMDLEGTGTTTVYKSRVNGYNVERKTQSLQETLTSLASRNMAAPAMRVESNETADVLKVWDNLKTMMFVDDVDERLEGFRKDKVEFEEALLLEWGKKAKPANVKKVMNMLVEGLTFDGSDHWVYDIMLKGDAKPPLSTKPMKEVIPPQLIAMNDKITGAFFSSIFRVMSRRFVSLFKPSIMVNLMKDTIGLRDHFAANHPWGTALKFLENDFSKFDKSQDRFSFMVVAHIMTELGFDNELLDIWMDANERVVLRSMNLGILLISRWQNKSGGPATALVNAITNVSAIATCYAGTDIKYGAIMGDDSLFACHGCTASPASSQMMAEMFNLESKYYILDYPYFTSCFILFDHDNKKVHMVPDPVKRCQRYSVSVNAVAPAWEEKARSARDTLVAYRHQNDLIGLDAAVRERYHVPEDVDIKPLFDALATISASDENFRSLYESEPTVLSL